MVRLRVVLKYISKSFTSISIPVWCDAGRGRCGRLSVSDDESLGIDIQRSCGHGPSGALSQAAALRTRHRETARQPADFQEHARQRRRDRKSTRMNSKSLMRISYAVFCLKNKNIHQNIKLIN